MGAPLWELLGISHPVFESTFYYSEVVTVCVLMQLFYRCYDFV